MKKILLAIASAAVLAHSASAQVTFSAALSAQTVNLASTNVFNVTFTLQSVGTGGPAFINGFDLFVESNTANTPNANNFFSITSATNLLSGSVIPSDTPVYPDTITTTGSTHAGFAQNTHSQGFSSDTNTSTTNPVPLETLSFSIANGTPNGTYFFNTTNATSSDPKNTSMTGGNDPNISDGTDFNTTNVSNNATFSITVVPEPATWSLVALGGLGAFGFNLLRRARRRN